ncbi:DUF4097 domain-containing protein [Micromonospora sp. NPDC000089]|uniref:DUF4097 family beta strand repeat-containing protein n=1 Tax=unclassified Micromonospora TaxID=2617518 RepID=UPI0036AF45EC
MPTFNTPGPVETTIEVVVGDVRITAADRDTTVVEVRPTDPAAEADVRAAEQTRVEYADGRLLIRAPRQKVLGMFGKPGSVDVTVDLPTGSSVRGTASVGAFRCAGRLDECRLKTSAGDLEVDRTGPLEASTSVGAVEVAAVAGRAEVSTDSGRIRIGEVDGAAVIKNSNGDSFVGVVAGDLRINAANGHIVVDRAGAGVTAATANGDIRLGEVSGGAVSMKTAMGRLEVGIRPGAAAWLDLHTQFGTVRNEIAPSDAPTAGDRTVEVRARTAYGDIVVRRS